MRTAQTVSAGGVVLSQPVPAALDRWSAAP